MPGTKVWVCLACGKMSNDQNGNDPISYGWDASCVLNSQQFDKDHLVIKDGRVIRVINPYEDTKKEL